MYLLEEHMAGELNRIDQDRELRFACFRRSVGTVNIVDRAYV